MKKNYLLGLLIMAIQVLSFAQTSHIITTSGFTFTPDSVNARVGDTIIFNVNFSAHPLQQVASTTWSANQSTPLAGGFSATSGTTFSVVMTQPGVAYYVCTMHVSSFGMKGRIFVSPANGIEKITPTASLIYPNPSGGQLHFISAASGHLSYAITDMLGKVILKDSQYANAQDRVTVDVADIAEGNYILSVSHADGSVSQNKIILKY